MVQVLVLNTIQVNFNRGSMFDNLFMTKVKFLYPFIVLPSEINQKAKADRQHLRELNTTWHVLSQFDLCYSK